MVKQNIHIKAMRHDLRHQLAVLQGFTAAGNLQQLHQYLEEMTGAIPTPAECAWCENYAVNAIADYYLSLLRQEGTTLDIRLEVPKSTGRVSDMELCIVLGNLLENALDASRVVPPEQRFVRARSHVQGNFLSLRIENGYSGLFEEHEGEYLSTKRRDDSQRPVRGIGLSSVKSICEKHEGMMKIEVAPLEWCASVLLTIE